MKKPIFLLFFCLFLTACAKEDIADFFTDECFGSDLIIQNETDKDLKIVLDTSGYIDISPIDLYLKPNSEKVFERSELFCNLSNELGQETYYYLVAFYRDNNIDKVIASQLYDIGPKGTLYNIFEENETGEIVIKFVAR
jgi:hypothetical protein